MEDGPTPTPNAWATQQKPFVRSSMVDDTLKALREHMAVLATANKPASRKILEDSVSTIETLRDLVRHCWVHSGQRNCGRQYMGEIQGRVYDTIVVDAIWDGS